MLTRCDNCGAVCAEEKLAKSLCQIHHLWERLDPGGGEVPAGECRCGALAYVLPDGGAVESQSKRKGL